MPRVTVVTLPQEVIEAPGLSSPKREVRKSSWKPAAVKIKDFFSAILFRHNLPLNILAFLLGRVSIMGEFAPFGIALFAAVAQVARERALAVGLWAMAGVMSGGHYSETAIYAFAIFLYYRLVGKITLMHRRLLAVPLLVFCAVACGGIFANVVQQGTLYQLLLVLFDAVMSMVLAYIFLYGVPVLLKRSAYDGFVQVSGDSLICMVALLAAAVAGFGDITVLSYSVRNIVGGLLVMVLALSGGSGLGAAVGVAVGLATGLTDGNVAVDISLYALAGTLGGVFRKLGKFAVILGFILGAMITILYFGQARELEVALAEMAVAAGLFVLLPAKRLALWRENLTEVKNEMPSGHAVDEARVKISHIADMFTDLAAAFESVSTHDREKSREEELNRTLTEVGEKVCSICSKRTLCWERDFYRTYQAVLDLLAQAEKDKLTIGGMPQLLREGCIKRAELVETIKYTVERNSSLTFWRNKLSDHRRMVTEQMKAAGVIIGNLAQEMVKEPRTNRELAGHIKAKAALIECQLDSVRVTGKPGANKIEACKQPCSGTRECLNSILPLTAALVHEKLLLHAECGSFVRNKKCKLTMETANRLKVSTGVAGAAKEPQDVSGDTCAVIPLSRGKIALVLSDGMGTGRQAAGESEKAVKCLRKLLTVGFDVDVAVKTVNCLLLLRTPEESFATMDMAIIDTYSGETEFLKIGSAPSYLKRVREVEMVRSSSLPIGIVQQIEIEPIKCQVVVGDIIVMVSDGVADAPQHGPDKESWLANFLRRTSSSNPQEIADNILRQAKELAGGRMRDDMTVLVAKVAAEPSGVP